MDTDRVVFPRLQTPERIELLRRRLGFTPAAFAEAAGLNKETVSDYRMGRVRRFSVDKLVPMARVLHTSIEYLACESDDPGEFWREYEATRVSSYAMSAA